VVSVDQRDNLAAAAAHALRAVGGILLPLAAMVCRVRLESSAGDHIMALRGRVGRGPPAFVLFGLTQFDRLYASMMIAHHDGAIQMAQDEAMKGTNADAMSLAKSIVKSQMAEVVTLQAIASRLG
jgi:hypothetical protein